MTIFAHDAFAKGFLETLLSPFGKVDPSYKIAAEVREVDVYFIPSGNNLDRTDLGLLGKCATAPVVIEPFRNSVSVPDIRACMSKLYDLHAKIYREAKRKKQPEPKDDELPMLWILTIEVRVYICYHRHRRRGLLSFTVCRRHRKLYGLEY
jgi:hypothetical protein